MADTTIRPVASARGNKPAPIDGRDPDVKIPARVRAEAERAEAIVKAQKEAPAEQDTPSEEPGITIVPEQPATPPTRTAVTDVPMATPPAQVDTPPATPRGEKTYSENDFNAMKVRYERADQAAKRLSEEVSNLRNVVAAMQIAPAPTPAAPPATPPELQAQSLLTPQEIADYGEDFLTVVGKKAREIAGAEIAGLKAEIEQLRNGVRATSQVSAAQARDTMLAHLDEKIPEWRNLNEDEKFLSWLRLPDPFSGAIRHDLLKAAYDQNNAARVQAFFQGFLAEEAAVAPANVPPATPGATPAPRVPLETFAAPGRAKSAAAHAPAEKPIITRAQVAAFYADVAAGKYRGREAEKEANELAIFAATNEGRLR